MGSYDKFQKMINTNKETVNSDIKKLQRTNQIIHQTGRQHPQQLMHVDLEELVDENLNVMLKDDGVYENVMEAGV